MRWTETKVKKTRSRAPSFGSYSASSETASRVKSRLPRRDTQAERLLRRELWRRGLRYRLECPDAPGRPDVIFPSLKVAVFCDGDFWHGRRWAHLRRRLRRGANPTYWLAKIQYNRRRDKALTRLLRANGWIVIRLWETDILAAPHGAAQQVASAVRRRKRQPPAGELPARSVPGKHTRMASHER